MTVLFMAGCDYNDKYFDGYDGNEIKDIVQYEGVYAGTYPEIGYFTDKSLLETGVDKMLKDTFKYVDAGSTAKIAIRYGDITPGLSATDMFAADYNYTLEKADYNAMGEASGEPGRYDNFDSYMDINHYISIFLKNRYPYALANKTAAVTYTYYASGATTTPLRIYKSDGSDWHFFDPYADVVEVSTKTAEMAFNGTDWKLQRLLGGSLKITIQTEELALLVDWVKAHKPEYMKDEKNEFYYGASTQHGNINNSYSNWKSNDPHKEYAGKSDSELQALMDERLASGLIELVLPQLITKPDSGMSYNVVYAIYGGRGRGNYVMSFMYNEEKKSFELAAGPVMQ
ncbi:hypothetical protein D0T51_05300 [Parabacteroides sp. 52]|nr:hypothetical protein [Parabacteroides sp. 52]